MIIGGIIRYALFGIILYFWVMFSRNDAIIHLGCRNKKAFVLFMKGIILGNVLFIVYLVIAIFLRIARIELYAKPISTEVIILAIVYLFISIFYCFAISLFEETLFRGLILRFVLKKCSYKVAIIISSAFFGVAHFFSYSASATFWIGLINATVIGILLCYIVLYTRSLMLPIGYHFSWNLLQEITIMNNNQLILIIIDDNTISGGKFTPEAGLLTSIILILLAMYMYIVKYRRQKSTPLEEQFL